MDGSERLAGEEISPELQRFIQSTINSIDQLEVLLFLMSNSEREWTAGQVSERVRVASEAVAVSLKALYSAHLLSSSQTDPPSYRYAPSSNALAEEVAKSLDRASKDNRETLIQLIYSRPLNNIKIFADAFRIKKKEDE